jgi:thiol-disulfide isomerase/thioredoxin
MRWLAVIALVLGCAETPRPLPPLPPSVLGSVEASRDLDGAVVGASPVAATIVISFASWCVHCHEELRVLAAIRAEHPALRILGLNFMGHEVYAGRGSARAVRAYVARFAPWLRVVPADKPLFDLFGHPPTVPTMFVFDRAGTLVETFARERAKPSADELSELLQSLGA